MTQDALQPHDPLPPLHWPIDIAASPFAPALLHSGALGWALSLIIALTVIVGTRATLWAISRSASWMLKGEWTGRAFLPRTARAWCLEVLAAILIGLLVHSQGPLLLIALRDAMLPVFLFLLCWNFARLILPGVFALRDAMKATARRAQDILSAACGLDLAILGLETVGAHLT